MLIQHDYKKSGTISLSSIQGFQNTYERRTSTKDCYLLYTSSRPKKINVKACESVKNWGELIYPHLS